MNTPEKELSDSLLAACKAAGIEKPRYIAQDEDGTVWHYDGEPDTTFTSDVGIFAFVPDIGEHAISLDHQPYAEDWKESLLEWVEPQEEGIWDAWDAWVASQGEPLVDVLARHPEHVADTSKKIDYACKIGYHKHVVNGDGLCWSRAGDYRKGWQDALAWKGGASE
jgi:hypothetical protein